jgi:flavin reductase (DIM6/NTAB) family NADH-FMN oxidoreductase RutF
MNTDIAKDRSSLSIFKSLMALETEMKSINKSEILSMDQRVRANFINSLSGAKSANLVGTIDGNGQTNLSIISSCFHLGANPALMGMIIRPRVEGAQRHTLDNIEEVKQWSINHVCADFVGKAHYTSARFSKECSEFSEAGFTEQFDPYFKVPFVQEAKLKILLSLDEVIMMKNKTELVVGEIQHVYLDDENCLLSDGSIDFSNQKLVALTGLDTYYKLEKISRFSYAKPGVFPKEI